jgi:hypothetical protein
MERLDLKSLFQKSLKVLRDQMKAWTVIPCGMSVRVFSYDNLSWAKTKTSARVEVYCQRGLLSGGVDRRGWRRS